MRRLQVCHISGLLNDNLKFWNGVHNARIRNTLELIEQEPCAACRLQQAIDDPLSLDIDISGGEDEDGVCPCCEDM